MSKKENYWFATGRRKTSTASVRLTEGKGKIIINNCDYNDYFGRDISKMIMKQPLELVNMTGKYDIYANVNANVAEKKPEILNIIPYIYIFVVNANTQTGIVVPKTVTSRQYFLPEL